MSVYRLRRCLTALAALLAGWMPSAATWSAAAEKSSAVFARVGEVVITREAYDQAYANAARGKFYHGKPPEAEVAKLQREVGDKLVNDVLLLAEARRRKLQPDQAMVAKQIEAYEARYAKSPQWQATRATALPPLKKKLEDDSLLAQLEASVRKVPDPTEKQLQVYYDKHKDKFTEPEQIRISLILLKVDPSSPRAQWEAAVKESEGILKQLRSGADFAEFARTRSGDESAKKGGDMGYVHRGMLPDAAQAAIDKLKLGELSAPVVLLEGVALIRLDGRKPPKLNSLSDVRERAKGLYLREASDQAWTEFVAKLRRTAQVQVDESRYLPLATAKPAERAASR